MRDIGRRIGRYRLSRYALPEDPVRRRLRWIWVALIGWLIWVGLISDHSFLRLWKLSLQNARARNQLVHARTEADLLDIEVKDKKALRARGERVLREKNGMARPDEIVYRIRSVPPESLLAR